MNASNPLMLTEHPITEKEQFWKAHAKSQRESGLSRMGYCRQHNISYDQFSYWERRWKQQTSPSRLLPIKINKTPELAVSPGLETLCTLAFKNGHELKIHDKTVLSMLLSLWS